MNQIPTTRIHESAVNAWTITASLYGLLWFFPSVIYLSLTWNHTVDWVLFTILTTIALVLFIATSFILPKLRWKRWRYDVSEKEIDMLRGIIITTRTLVPINRVQHVDTRQGPIYRKFGLSSVTISTAATTHEIPALDDATADALRNTIATLVRRVKEDV
ncbi:MAG: PH domain-containing protein [Balneolaceae bacterium]